MIESMIITLREGIEIALVIGILVVYLQKVGQPKFIISVYAGLLLAVIASIAGGIILQRLAIDQESLEGYFLIIAALFVMSMIVWMWITAKKIRTEIHEKIDTILLTTSSWKTHAGVLLFTFFMVVREGIETAIFLQAVMFSTGEWQSLTGAIAGIVLATLFALFFIRGSVKIDIARFLKVTAITLLIFAIQLGINAVHEFFENGVFPANPRMMGILGPIVQNDIFFIGAILCIPAFMMLIPGKKQITTVTTGGQRRWQLGAAILSLLLILFLGASDVYSSHHEIDLTSLELQIPHSRILTIPINEISDNNLHRFCIHDNGIEIRFFVVRKSLSNFATAFDACHACYAYGKYYLKNDNLICSQCDAPFPLSKLRPTLTDEPVDMNNSGSMEGNGCAPIYLPSKMHNGSIEILLSDLQKQRKYFDINQE
jgi:high-affinity iron transporter